MAFQPIYCKLGCNGYKTRGCKTCSVATNLGILDVSPTEDWLLHLPGSGSMKVSVPMAGLSSCTFLLGSTVTMDKWIKSSIYIDGSQCVSWRYKLTCGFVNGPSMYHGHVNPIYSLEWSHSYHGEMNPMWIQVSPYYRSCEPCHACLGPLWRVQRRLGLFKASRTPAIWGNIKWKCWPWSRRVSWLNLNKSWRSNRFDPQFPISNDFHFFND